ncbi:MAG TPA: hypothetical protein VFU48_05325 [Nitrospira sp.]|nr:hypothetical protein [Nitrospira sp.]
MADLPIESRNKYGAEVYDDADIFADLLSGREPGSGGSARPSPQSPTTEAVDEDFFREAGNPSRKYGI